MVTVGVFDLSNANGQKFVKTQAMARPIAMTTKGGSYEFQVSDPWQRC